MKGLVILAGLALAIGGSLYALLRPSDTDLTRVEDDIGDALDRSRQVLAESVRVLNPLRLINPTLLPLDHDLAALRTRSDQASARLENLRGSRPAGAAAHEAALRERKEARADAQTLLADTTAFAQRVGLTDSVLRETQPLVQTMLGLWQRAAATREQIEQTGATLDADLALKVDQIARRVGETRNLAAQARDAAMRDAKEGDSMARTAAADTQAVIADLKTVIEKLETLRSP